MINNNIGIFDPTGININPLNNKEFSNKYKNLSTFWSNLPAYKYGNEIVDLINKNDVALVIFGTGGGKTVLIPKFALHANNYEGKIVITLPKKIITKKAAEFSAETLDVQLGEQVGYQVRGDNIKSEKTVLLYSTDGSIISQIRSDPLLSNIDIIIIDEAHERKVPIDSLLYFIRNAIKIRKEKNMKPLKLIIMSATINENIFKQYFQSLNFGLMKLSGKPNFPIKNIYLESPIDVQNNEYIDKGKSIIKQIIYNITNSIDEYVEGDILFFVTTVSECETLTSDLQKELNDSFIMALYSGYDSELEQYVSNPEKYKELNINFKRIIFISTNVAESSLTIDGIVYVIDAGLELFVSFNPIKNVNFMTKKYITQAQMTQRKGRAGRTRPGICYKLYTVKDEDNTIEFPEPEIKCIDIKNLCLTLLKLGSDINNSDFTINNMKEMLENFIDPPDNEFINNSVNFLIKNNLVENNILSKLGKLVINLKLDVQECLTLVYAHNISLSVVRAVFKILIICSHLKNGIDNLFNPDIDDKTKLNILKQFSNKSDFVLLYELYKYINNDSNNGLFNIEKFTQIKYSYKNQIHKIITILNEYSIKIDEIDNIKTDNIKTDEKDLEMNIFNAFSYGYNDNIAIKKGEDFYYNKLKCKIKSKINIKNANNILFYSNMLYNGKLNLSICMII